MTPATYFTEDSGTHHFGAAPLHDRRRTRSLVDLADRLLRHPGGSLPDKFSDPNALRRCYDLMNCPEVTHEAGLASHRQATFDSLGDFDGTVVFRHDTTELDYTTHTERHGQLGQIDNVAGQGFL